MSPSTSRRPDTPPYTGPATLDWRRGLGRVVLLERPVLWCKGCATPQRQAPCKKRSTFVARDISYRFQVRMSSSSGSGIAPSRGNTFPRKRLTFNYLTLNVFGPASPLREAEAFSHADIMSRNSYQMSRLDSGPYLTRAKFSFFGWMGSESSLERRRAGWLRGAERSTSCGAPTPIPMSPRCKPSPA